MMFPIPARAASFAVLALVILGASLAAAEPMRPCGWQGDEAPWPLHPDGEISNNAATPGATRLQLESASGQGGVEYCGGAVLAANWVLTARHCVEGRVWHDLRVTAGTDALQTAGKGVERHAAAAYCAPRRGGTALKSDIALLRLTEPFPDGVASARLATFAETTGTTFPFTGIIASWPVKYRNPDPQPVLQSEFEIISRDASGVFFARPVSAKKSPPCSGESGSALWQETPQGPVVRGILSAVSSASEGDAAKSARDICRSADMVAHITDTARQFAWIRETMDICDASADACLVRP